MAVDRNPETRMRTSLDSAVVGVFQAAASGKFLTANLILARMLGSASPADLIAASTDFTERLCSDPELRLEFRRLLEVRGVVRDFEVPVEQKEGGTRWLSVNARAVRDGDGNILRYEGTAADITERRHAEEALRTSLERFQALVANSAEEIVVARCRPEARLPQSFGRSRLGLLPRGESQA